MSLLIVFAVAIFVQSWTLKIKDYILPAKKLRKYTSGGEKKEEEMEAGFKAGSSS